MMDFHLQTMRFGKGWQIGWLLLALLMVSAVGVGAQTPAGDPVIAPEVRAALEEPASGGTVTVIVSLRDPVAIDAPSVERALAVALLVGELNRTTEGDGFSIVRQYSHVPGVVAQVDDAALNALAANPLVESIQLDLPTVGHMGEAAVAINARAVQQTLGYSGAGVRIAVLDTGVATAHPDLTGKIFGQICLTGGNDNATPSCPPNGTGTGTSAEDGNGHGTNVTGILVAEGVIAARGIAPDATIYAIRVLGDDNRGWVSDWLDGLNHIIANQATLDIDLVNMSLGTTTLYSGTCDNVFPVVTNAVNQLRALGVPVTASSANNGSATTISLPACLSTAVGVGATYDSAMGRRPASGTYRTLFGTTWPDCFDNPTGVAVVACFSNTSTAVDFLAPGARITSAWLNNTIATYNGTSQAAPMVAGTMALMLEANPRLTPDALELALATTGIATTDPRDGITRPRIDALAAVNDVLRPTAPTTVIDPQGAIADPEPLLTWARVAEADWYLVWIDRDDGTHVFDQWVAAADCPGATCALDLTAPLPPATYRLWVRTWSVIRDQGDWSNAVEFTIGGVPDPIAPEGATSDTTPSFRFIGVPGVTWYLLWLDAVTETGVDHVFDGWSPAAAVCAGVDCMIDPALTLPGGAYLWWVRGWSALGGLTGWSRPVVTTIIP